LKKNQLLIDLINKIDIFYQLLYNNMQIKANIPTIFDAILASDGFIYIRKNLFTKEKHIELYNSMSNIIPFNANKKFNAKSFSIYAERMINELLCVRFPRIYGIKVIKDLGIKFSHDNLAKGLIFDKKYENGTKYYDYQIDAIEAIYEKYIAGSLGSLLILSTGSGKTLTSIEIARRIGRKCVIVVKTKSLARQWKDEIDALFKINCVIISELHKDDMIQMNGGNITKEKKRINISSIGDFAICVRNSLIGKKFIPSDFNGFGTVIIDEVHGIMSEKVLDMFKMISRRFIIGITATPKVASGLEFLLDWYIGKIGFEMTMSYKGAKPLIHMIKYKPPTIWDTEMKKKYCQLIKFKNGIGKNGSEDKVDFTTTEINTTVYNKDRYMLPLIRECIANKSYLRIIVLCKYRKQIDNIYAELTRKEENNTDNDVGIFYSVSCKKDKKLQIETLKNKRVIISIMALGKESLNIVDCNCLIILNAPIIKKDKDGNWNTQGLDQVCGRCLRKKWIEAPHIYIINDMFSFFRNHYNNRIMYFKDIKGWQLVE